MGNLRREETYDGVELYGCFQLLVSLGAEGPRISVAIDGGIRFRKQPIRLFMPLVCFGHIPAWWPPL